MAWNNIVPDDVVNELTAGEIAALENIQGVNALPGILTNVIRAARGSIAAGGNQLDAASQTSIPDQLRNDVIDIARWRWLRSFPQLKTLQTPERRDAAKVAQEKLDLIASNNPNRPKVEIPDVASTTTKAPVGAVGIARAGTHVHRHGFGKFGST